MDPYCDRRRLPSHARLLEQPERCAGQEARHPGHHDGRRGGKRLVRLLQLRGRVGRSSYHRFSFPNGTRGVSETTMFVRGDRVWLGGSGGVELLRNGHFYLLGWKNQELPGRVSGVMETKTGDLWMNGFSGITHVSAAELARWLRDPSYLVSGERLDALDGLPGLSAERIPEPSVAESRDGRMWFATTRGIAWLDPATLHKSRNRLPPPVLISTVISNGMTYPGSGDLTLPAHTERLEINYTALSLDSLPGALPLQTRWGGFRMAERGNAPPGLLHPTAPGTLSLSRDRLQQRWRVERSRSESGSFD